jgi:hypothetical protein
MANVVEVLVKGDASKLKKEIGGVTGAIQKFAGPAAIGAAVVGLAGLAKGAIDAGSRLEQSVGGVDAVFKETADTIHAFGETSAETVGLATSEFNGLATLTGALFKNMGVPIQESADKTLILTQRGADLAATFGGPVSGAMEAINSALKGENNPIEAYGIKLSAAAVEARVLADNHGLLKSEIEDAHKAQAVYNIIMDQSADSAGQFGREAKTAAGQQERLNAELENAKAEIGAGLLPLWVTLLETARDFVPVIKDAAEGMVDLVAEMKPLIDALGWLITQYNNLKGGLDDAKESENSFMQFLGEAGDAVLGFGGGLGVLIKGIESLGEAEAETTESIEAQDDAMFAAAERAMELKGATDEVTTATDELRLSEEELTEARNVGIDAELDMLNAREDQNEALERLIELQQSGTATADEIRIAELELARETEDLRLKTEAYNLSLDALNGKRVDVSILTNWITQGANTVAAAASRNRASNMHSGGIVPGPRGSDQLVLAQAGEHITPLSGSGGGPTVVINVAGSLVTERDLVELVRKELVKIAKRNGTTGII